MLWKGVCKHVFVIEPFLPGFCIVSQRLLATNPGRMANLTAEGVEAVLQLQVKKDGKKFKVILVEGKEEPQKILVKYKTVVCQVPFPWKPGGPLNKAKFRSLPVFFLEKS